MVEVQVVVNPGIKSRVDGEILAKLWNLVEIVKFGRNCEIWIKLPGIKGRVARECKGVVAGGEAGENSCVQIHRTIATSVLET